MAPIKITCSVTMLERSIVTVLLVSIVAIVSEYMFPSESYSSYDAIVEHYRSIVDAVIVK